MREGLELSATERPAYLQPCLDSESVVGSWMWPNPFLSVSDPGPGVSEAPTGNSTEEENPGGECSPQASQIDRLSKSTPLKW